MTIKITEADVGRRVLLRRGITTKIVAFEDDGDDKGYPVVLDLPDQAELDRIYRPDGLNVNESNPSRWDIVAFHDEPAEPEPIRFKVGDHVVHKRNKDWGIGIVVDLDDDGDPQVDFANPKVGKWQCIHESLKPAPDRKSLGHERPDECKPETRSPLSIPGLEIAANGDQVVTLKYKGQIKSFDATLEDMDEQIAALMLNAEELDGIKCNHSNRTESGGRRAWCESCGASLSWTLEGGWQ